jgi:hypothetical protein
VENDNNASKMILMYLLERFKQGDVVVCLADVLEHFGHEPDTEAYEIYYELTDKFFEEQDVLFAALDQPTETRH